MKKYKQIDKQMNDINFILSYWDKNTKERE